MYTASQYGLISGKELLSSREYQYWKEGTLIFIFNMDILYFWSVHLYFFLND